MFKLAAVRVDFIVRPVEKPDRMEMLPTSFGIEGADIVPAGELFFSISPTKNKIKWKKGDISVIVLEN